jgi:hypothetical protein
MGQHPLPGIILQFRKLAKNMSEMHSRIQDAAAAASAAAAAVVASSRGKAAAADDAAAAAAGLVRVRGQWMQTCHASGRLSSATRKGSKRGNGSSEAPPSLQCVANNIQYELHTTVTVTAARTGGGYADSDAECSEDDSDGEAAAAAEGVCQSAPSAAAAAAAAAGLAEVGPSEPQQQQQHVHTASVRAGFVAPPGCVILGADYCQIEFRLMAHFSGDKGMLQVCEQHSHSLAG